MSREDPRETVRIQGSANVVAKLASIKSVLAEKGSLSLRIPDDDFAPAIVKGDKIKAIKVDPGDLREGHVVLIETEKEIIVRRIARIEKMLFHLTDDQGGKKTTTHSYQILAKVKGLKRGNEKIIFPEKPLMKEGLGGLIARIFKRK